MSERLGAEHYGEERAETAEAKAEGIIADELKRRNWKAAERKTPRCHKFHPAWSSDHRGRALFQALARA